MNLGVNTLFLIPGEVGGTETYTIETLKAMCTSQPSIRLTIFTNLENDELLTELFGDFGNIKIVQVDVLATRRPMRILYEQLVLPRLAKKHAVDVLWSPGNVSPLWTSCPRVVTIHDMQYVHYREDFTLLSLLAIRLFVSLTLKSCKRILTISEFSKSEIEKYGGVTADNIIVTYEGASDQFSSVLSESEIGVLTREVTGGFQYILCIANSYPHKNLHTLVRAFGELRVSEPLKLIIVGKARMGESMLQRAISSIKNTEDVVRVSSASFKQLSALYQGCKIFAFPSLYEGFGLPILESMKSGALIVTTRNGSIPEIAANAVIYADKGDVASFTIAMQRALSLEPHVAQDFKNRAKERSMLFDWNDVGKRTFDAIRACIETTLEVVDQ